MNQGTNPIHRALQYEFPFMKDLDDLSPMPFGRHKGAPMQDVPASYFHWLWTEGGMKNNKVDPVANYIRSRLNHLKKEYPDGIWD